MRKFVTCPAVTVLDNDHALLIDSPSAGTNSITADNAADTLLSKWSGFNTFDEAVQNTISNNQEFIDRDTAIREETADLKKKIVTTFPAKEASGQIATFESEFEDAPLKSCVVQVEPVQEGSGDPSPDNIRHIIGWTGCEVRHSGADMTNPTTYPITFPTEAATVYGGYVDVTGGELVVDRVMDTFDGTEEWNIIASDKKRICMRSLLSHQKMETSLSITQMISNSIPLSVTSEASSIDNNRMTCRGTPYLSRYLYIFVPPTMFTTTDALKAYLAQTPLQIVYPIATPIHYPLTPIDIKTLLGQNNLWADTGDTSVEYLMSDVSWYVEKKLRAFQSVLAGVEDSAVASKNYSTNSYLIFNDNIYRVTKTITAGETIEDGVNVTKTTVAEQLMALAQA